MWEGGLEDAGGKGIMKDERGQGRVKRLEPRWGAIKMETRGWSG